MRVRDTPWLTLLGLIIFAAVAVAQDSQDHAPFRTFGVINGRGWRVFSPDSKISYIEGVKAGLGMAVVRTPVDSPCDVLNKGTVAAFSAEGFTQGEILEAVDRFYDQPENLLIKITDALEIVSAKARGVPQDVIETKTSQRRRAANEAPERK